MLLLLILLPLMGSVPLLLVRSESETRLGRWSCAVTGLTLLVMVLAVCTRFGVSLDIPLCGIHFTLDGFRAIYGLVVSFMWFVSALLTPQYFRGHHHLRRYHFFFLLCLSFTLGVFLSADLYTTFLFFELMSLSSYAWVVQEESPDALDAGKTYLAIAVLGGLVTLMGLFLLYRLTGTLVIAQLPDACAMVTDRGQLWAAALCILFGFAAKAGVFPLHIWLPKAHPVAPAPASALLSGVLTKAGIFGALIITADILPGEHRWGVLLLVLGAVTMVLGAAIAVFSNNLKYILACSSLSQIGFILVGTAALSLLGQHNALAAHGTVLYMMNHSLVKLTLFLLAGVVYCNTHALDLNQIRGYGRGKPLLHGLFLCGACSLAGIPGFLGYISKTLVHESLVELAAESGSLGVTAVEWLFLFSGGLTAAYLTKIYVALFWQKPISPTGKTWGTPMTVAALVLAGCIPGAFMLKNVDARLIKFIFGFVVSALGVEMLLRERRQEKRPASKPVLALIGVLAGVLCGLFGVGALMAAYVGRVTETNSEFKANMNAVFFVEGTFRLILYLCLGLITPASLRQSLILMPCMLAGIFLGSRCSRKLNEKVVKKLVIFTLILSGILLILRNL